MVDVKICGVTTPDILEVASRAGARYIGFVFVSSSPRYIHPEQARILSRQMPTGVRSVGLFSDPDDETLSRTLSAVPLDYIQLHGNETPSRVAQIKATHHLPVIKAFSVSLPEDVERVESYLPVIDWILFDSKPHPSANLTGGSGVPFDWNILKGKTFSKPWMLSGGLTPETVADALSKLAPDAVDVSSGVEKERGKKDPEKIRNFIEEVKRTPDR